VRFLPDLLALRRIARQFRDLIDKSCAHIGFALTKSHFHAFDDAILAVRLQRMPFQERCHFNPQTNEYSFIPTQDFFQSVMEDRPTPEGCPSIPQVYWIDECAAVMDLYLLALAWESTTEERAGMTIDEGSCVNTFSTFTIGTNIMEYFEGRAPKFFEYYLSSFYRISIFGALFGPRVFAEPVLNAMDLFGKPTNCEEEVDDAVIEETRRFSIFRTRNDGEESDLYREVRESKTFTGFFDWLYAQPCPTNEIIPGPYHRSPSRRPPHFTEEERQQTALMQIWKVAEFIERRNVGERPLDGHHVKAAFNPAHRPPSLLPVIALRLKLRISPWSKPQAIIDHWAKSNTIHSIVAQPQCHPSCLWVPGITLQGFLDEELEHRFKMKYDPVLSEFDRGPAFGFFEPELYPLDQDRPFEHLYH